VNVQPERPAIIPPDISAQTRILAVSSFSFAGVVAGTIVLLLLLYTPQPDIEDKQPFRDALKIWHPFVMTAGSKNTPRTGKRFQNRVRYLAMRQRALRTKEPEPLVIKLLRRTSLLKRAQERAQDQAVPPIPERLLVGFAAIDDYAPDAIWNAASFKTIVEKRPWKQFTDLNSTLKESDYESAFNEIGEAIPQYRDSYLRLSSETRKGQNPKKQAQNA
jgi:hypothetical protein